MPEPVTLIVGGFALYSWLKSRNAAPAPSAAQLAAAPATATAGAQPLGTESAGTGPDAPMATNGSVLTAQAGGSLSTSLAMPITSDIAVPADLVAALDNDTAQAMQAYAHLNPADFQLFLDRYADRIQLRNDLVIQKLTNPPDAPPIQPTPGMLVGMGTAAYKVAQAINGVAAGKSVDIFGVAASAAGQIPGISPDVVSSLQGLAMGYRAITSLNDVLNIATANGVSVMDFTAMTAAGAYPGLAALPLAGVLMAVGLVVDIGFTIIGDAPDLQKAVDVALDVASLACLFIPVIGVVIAIVIQLVKFIIDLFGDDLFGGGMSHEQREVLETARYGENLNPMFPQLAGSYTPRELFRTCADWTSGYCGGKHVVAMAVNLVLKEGDVIPIGGRMVTVTANDLGTGAPVLLPPGADGITLGIGDNGANGGGCYWLQGTPFAAMTNDEIAWALAKYAATNGVVAEAQAGIAEWRKDQFNTPVENLIQARAQTMKVFIDHNLSLDQMDQIALEYRAQPHLKELAAAYGWATWQELFASTVAVEWDAFHAHIVNGSLSDFAKLNGYPTMYAFRAAALGTFESYWSRAQQATATVNANAAAARASYQAAQTAIGAAQQAFTSGP